jgi:hypothetical protein
MLVPFATTMRTVLADKEIDIPDDPDVRAFSPVFHDVISPTIQ